MAFINDRVFDNGLTVLDTEANRLDICSTEPGTYAAATSTNTLGNKTSLSIGAPADRTPNGRKVTVAAITDGGLADHARDAGPPGDAGLGHRRRRLGHLLEQSHRQGWAAARLRIAARQPGEAGAERDQAQCRSWRPDRRGAGAVADARGGRHAERGVR